MLAAASSIALAAVVVNLSTPPVHADALVPQAAVTARTAPSVTSTTPSVLEPQHQPAVKTENERRRDILKGLATWYGGVFNGRLTASGERFDMNAMTACHPTLPFGSVVRVVNLRNNRSCVVRITDRGYLFKGRIIDLSYAAARELAMTRDGVAKVKLEVLSFGKPPR